MSDTLLLVALAVALTAVIFWRVVRGCDLEDEWRRLTRLTMEEHTRRLEEIERRLRALETPVQILRAQHDTEEEDDDDWTQG